MYTTYIYNLFEKYISLDIEDKDIKTWTARKAYDILKSKKMYAAFDLEELMAKVYDDYGFEYKLIYFEDQTFHLYQDRDWNWRAPSLGSEPTNDKEAVRQWLDSLGVRRFVSYVYTYDRPKVGVTYSELVKEITTKNQKIFL